MSKKIESENFESIINLSPIDLGKDNADNVVILKDPMFTTDSIGRVIAKFTVNVLGEDYFIVINNNSFDYKGETVNEIVIQG